MVREERYELLSRDGLSLVIEAVADDEKTPLLLLCPLGGQGSLFDLMSDETPANRTAGDPECFCDAPLALVAVSVSTDDLGVSDRIVCHSSCGVGGCGASG